MDEVDCSYIEPEQLFVNDDGLFEAIVPALLLDRADFDRLWNEQRLANRQHNIALYTGNILKQSSRHG